MKRSFADILIDSPDEFHPGNGAYSKRRGSLSTGENRFLSANREMDANYQRSLANRVRCVQWTPIGMMQFGTLMKHMNKFSQ